MILGSNASWPSKWFGTEHSSFSSSLNQPEDTLTRSKTISVSFWKLTAVRSLQVGIIEERREICGGQVCHPEEAAARPSLCVIFIAWRRCVPRRCLIEAVAHAAQPSGDGNQIPNPMK